MPITLLDTEYATLWYYPEDKIIHHRLKKFIFGDHVRSFLTASVEAIEKYGCHKYLSDDREMTAFHPDDAAWNASEYIPRLVQAGWTDWALVPPTRIIGQAYMARVVERIRARGVNVAIFKDVDEALAWLKAQQSALLGDLASNAP